MKVISKANVIYGFITTLGVSIFGEHWFLFFGFLALNIGDYFSGWRKARYLKTESSSVGARGILKKVGYWAVIAIAFFISMCFEEMGAVIGIDLSFLHLFGWFTLASYIVNEIRSILENLVAMNITVPQFLVAGLEITQKLIDEKTDIKGVIDDEDERQGDNTN